MSQISLQTCDQHTVIFILCVTKIKGWASEEEAQQVKALADRPEFYS